MMEEYNIQGKQISFYQYCPGTFGYIIVQKENEQEKTDVMFCSKYPENINIKMDDDALKQVKEFKWLSTVFTEGGGGGK